jgi:3-phosphoshikimate 1-carboxyvinyltransferase
MKALISPSRLQGKVEAPPSKSCFQRACLAAWIRGGNTVITNPGRSEDDEAALHMIREMGAFISRSADELRIHVDQKKFPSRVNCGESGLSARMFIPLLALSDSTVMVEGRGSLLRRPLGFFDEVLPKLGVEVRSNAGYLPLEIRGPLHPADIEIDGSQSSQYLTGLIMAYAAAGARDTFIRVHNLQSRPYIDLTLSVLESFGLPVPVNENYASFYFPGEIQQPDRGELRYRVEGDWSNGAMLLAAGALNGPLQIRGLDLLSTQADRAIVDILMEANAALSMDAKGIGIHPAEMKAFSADATNCPDLFPPLVALATQCRGCSVIRGAGRLRDKESDRGAALREEFGKMGVDIRLEDELMFIEGSAQLKPAIFSSHADHRIAMALAISALRAEGNSVIEDAGAVQKSYPAFFDDLRSLGASITLQDE